MKYEQIIQILEEKGFSVYKTGKDEEIRLDCPFCIYEGKTADRKKHLYINIEKGLVHCFRCDYGGSFKTFLKDLDDYSRSRLTFRQYNKLQKALGQSQLLKIDIPFPRIDTYNNPARDYLISYIRDKRKLKEDVIWEYDLRAGLEAYSGRIVFPVKEKFVDIYFTSRKIFENNYSKYKNPSVGEYGIVVGKSEVLYNIDGVPEETDHVVIQEGPLDVISTHLKPYPSVAILGKSLSRSQLFKLLLKKPKEVIICLDSDATKSAFSVAEIVSKFVPTSVLILSEGDPGDWKERYLQEGQLVHINYIKSMKDKLENMWWEGESLLKGYGNFL